MSSDTFIRHDDDGSAALHTANGAWIDYAAPGPSQLERLSSSALRERVWRDAWRKAHPAPWYAPVLGALILLAVIAALVGLYSILSTAFFKLAQS